MGYENKCSEVKSNIEGVRVETIPPTTPSLRVTLDLTAQQATDILRLTAYVGGDARTTTRGVFERLGRALREAGVSEANARYGGQTIYFN